MKIILSRKGFDSSNGGIPSPIMPDGTLLSMPIPTEDKIAFSDIQFKGMSYADILRQLASNATFTTCHLDPDIRDNRILPVDGWKPAFGQIGAAQGLLKNAGVGIGDLFLFFGWFRQVEEGLHGYQFSKKNKTDFFNGSDLQIVYGYMQVGDIISDQKQIEGYYWHPHASALHTKHANNVLYIPTEKLSINPSMKGYGTLNFRKDRVLTMEGCNRGTWNEYEFLMPQHVYGNKKNSAKGKGLYYSGIWQELVVDESPELMKWVTSILE